MATQKIFKVICNTFGHKFSFNAKDDEDAERKLFTWVRYHSFQRRDFQLEETNEEKRIHNEYVD